MDRIADAGRLLTTACQSDDPRIKDAAFTQAWRLLTTELDNNMRSWTRSYKHGGIDLVDEAFSHWSVKLWRQIQRGYIPPGGWASTLVLAARGAAYETLAKQTRQHEGYTDHDLDQIPSPTPPDAIIDELDNERARRLMLARLEGWARLAELEYCNWMWAGIIRATASGIDSWDGVALSMGVSAGSVREALSQMRRSGLFDDDPLGAPVTLFDDVVGG